MCGLSSALVSREQGLHGEPMTKLPFLQRCAAQTWRKHRGR